MLIPLLALKYGSRLFVTALVLLSSTITISSRALAAEQVSKAQAMDAMRKAATFFRTKVASHGGYVYSYSPDFARRWGEGEATGQQIWVQRPGTPAVGMSYLKAFAATGDAFYLDAARKTAQALVYGQLESGGWTNAIDFDPRGSKVALYRNGKGRGRNHSTFDDGITQHALRFLMHTDRALDFKNGEIHQACEIARNAVLAAQFPSGGFPQGWTGPVVPHAVVKASYPDYEWRTENRIKDYWDMLTLNDGLAGDNAEMLWDAWQIYGDEHSRKALARLGDFLLLSQMPEPQPAWSQQYDTQMRPIWARRFEPPAITGNESQDVMETLIFIYRATGDAKYLEPIPRALAYLRRSLLPDGQLSRFYELRTNKPLYMTREYVLTYDDSDVPDHYSWKTRSRLEAIGAALIAAHNRMPEAAKPAPNSNRIQQIIESLDAEGRWISTHTGAAQTREPKFKPGDAFISSDVFSKNLDLLSEYVGATK